MVDVTSGYTGGHKVNPTYEYPQAPQAIMRLQVTYDPEKIRYEQLLDIFWRSTDLQMQAARLSTGDSSMGQPSSTIMKNRGTWQSVKGKT